MRFKAGIWLLGLIMLLGMAGCAETGAGKNAATPSKTAAVQEKDDKSPTEKLVPTTAANKGTQPDREKADEQMGESAKNLNVRNTVASKETEALAAKQGNPAKINITGTGVKSSREYSLEELKQMNDILVSACYFSRGAEKPGWGKTAHTAFGGVLLYELLADHVGLNKSASQVKIIAEDDYTQVFSLEEIKADYIDETDSKVKLRMIIAWSQDGHEYDDQTGVPFRLVVGQQFTGDYNRLKWVNQIASIVVE